MVRCASRNARGDPCGAEALSDRTTCAMHTASVHREMSARGGRASSRSDLPVDVLFDTGSAQGILDSLASVGTALARGELDRARANGLSYILSTAVQARKILDYENRLRAIEVKLGLR